MTVILDALRALWRPAVAAALALALTEAQAAPWAEVGDVQLRSDIETLAAAGVIDPLTTQWPLPWARILDRLSATGALNTQPGYVVDAADRIRQQASGQMMQDVASFSAYFDLTNAPEVVRGFDALGRDNVQTQGRLSWNGEKTFVQLSAGIKSHDRYDSETIMLDGTYVARQIGGAAVYLGELTHWWGPGWISALSMSNNAAPVPQIGISRIDTSPFRSKWLSWMGPWQAEFFLGTLQGDQIPKHTLVDGLRFNINPLPGLDFAVERMDEACGRGHPCNPANYFNLSNNYARPSKTNDQGDFDIKYSHRLGAVDLSAYLQLMNEDSNPFWHSGTSHLFGITGFIPVGETRVRITAEYTDTVATQQIFSFGDYFYGFPYNDYKYPGGMRNLDRALGFSLDSDGKLATLQASWLGPHRITWTLTYHHADLNVPVPVGAGASLYSLVNFVSSAPVSMSIGEARASFALNEQFSIDAEVRYSTDQPRPDVGAKGSGEIRIRYGY